MWNVWNVRMNNISTYVFLCFLLFYMWGVRSNFEMLGWTKQFQQGNFKPRCILPSFPCISDFINACSADECISTRCPPILSQSLYGKTKQNIKPCYWKERRITCKLFSEVLLGTNILIFRAFNVNLKLKCRKKTRISYS